MLAYHNDPSIKTKYVNRMKAHMEAGALIQGTGWNGCKGCAIGCTFEIYDHALGPVEIGVPETLLWLEDDIFESLPWVVARSFPLTFLEVIPVGANLSLVWPRFGLWLLASPQYGVLRHCNDNTRPSVEAVIGLYRRWIGGEKPSAAEFEAAARAAAEAARTTWAASEEARTTWAAARTAAVTARVVAWASAEAALSARATSVVGMIWAARAARMAKAIWVAAGSEQAAGQAAERAAQASKVNFWLTARDELLRLLQDAPVGG